MDKNPSAFYGAKYLTGTCRNDRPEKKNEDNGFFYGAAKKLDDAAKKYGVSRGSYVDVGCGRGFVVRHMLNMNYDAVGVEYGPLKEIAPVVPHRVRWGDLTGTLPVPDGFAKLVSCFGVLSHIPEESVPHALGEVNRILSRGGIVCATIQTKNCPDQAHHKTFKPRDWWEKRFEDAGFDIVFIHGNWTVEIEARKEDVHPEFRGAGW